MERAYAVVLRAKQKRSRAVSGTEGVHLPERHKAEVRIEPPGGEPFEATLRFTADIPAFAPHEGGTVPVLFDRERRRVEWDEQTARDDHARRAGEDRQRRDAIAAERAAAGQAPLGTDGPDPELIAELQALEARKAAGELNDWQFREARAEIMKRRGF